MSLSNMNKDVITRLMKMISCNNENELSAIKADHANFGKLNLLASQIQMLQIQAQEIVAQSKLNRHLKQINVTHTRVAGTVYHLYIQNKRDILSIIGPSEWSMYEKYSGAFLYDFDHTFKPIENRHTSIDGAEFEVGGDVF